MNPQKMDRPDSPVDWPPHRYTLFYHCLIRCFVYLGAGRRERYYTNNALLLNPKPLFRLPLYETVSSKRFPKEIFGPFYTGIPPMQLKSSSMCRVTYYKAFLNPYSGALIHFTGYEKEQPAIPGQASSESPTRGGWEADRSLGYPVGIFYDHNRTGTLVASSQKKHQTTPNP